MVIVKSEVKVADTVGGSFRGAGKEGLCAEGTVELWPKL